MLLSSTNTIQISQLLWVTKVKRRKLQRRALPKKLLKKVPPKKPLEREPHLQRKFRLPRLQKLSLNLILN